MTERDRVIAETFAALDRHKRPTAIAQIGGFRPPADPITSTFGGRFVAAPDQAWPLYAGQPMLPLLQVRTDELSFVPTALAGVALLTIYIDSRHLPTDLPAENGNGWLIRTYPALDGLTPMPTPTGSWLKPFPIRWQAAEGEGPDWHGGTKVGGWPAYVQDSPEIEGYVLQIGSEEKPGWMWGDNGTGYVYHRDGQWYLYWDCY